MNKIQKMSSLSDEAVIKYQSTFKSIYLCQDTYQSAAVAAGSCLNIVDSVMTGKASTYEQQREKTGLRGFRPGKTLTRQNS